MTANSSAQQQMRRIDEQLTKNRQQIAVLQLENVRLEDARLMLASLAEQDAIEAGRPAGLQIRVGPPSVAEALPPPKKLTPPEKLTNKQLRDREGYQRRKAKAEAEKLAAARALGCDTSELVRRNGQWQRRQRGVRTDKGRVKGRMTGEYSDIVTRVRAFMQKRTEPVPSGAAIDAFKAKTPAEKGRIYQAFHVLLKDGELIRTSDYRYLPATEVEAMPNGGMHG